jgi:hypothetical protein
MAHVSLEPLCPRGLSGRGGGARQSFLSPDCLYSICPFRLSSLTCGHAPVVSCTDPSGRIQDSACPLETRNAQAMWACERPITLEQCPHSLPIN